ncbi:5-azacytidine-induced protein 2 isoform X3 [Lethenteron reissneri]|uniref:5-azacytidine-induced protein 2 isoform X3 n=1 Tax=Lethenteron reissneri TaxID=7753 RepID=UPI002AB6BE4B|nr:5-azacytidine-induced protein 2 isoform X3 [Lethenteron reissneri]
MIESQSSSDDDISILSQTELEGEKMEGSSGMEPLRLPMQVPAPSQGLSHRSESEDRLGSHGALLVAYGDLKTRLQQSERENQFLRQTVRTQDIKIRQLENLQQNDEVDGLQKKVESLEMEVEKTVEQLQAREVELLQMVTETETLRVRDQLYSPQTQERSLPLAASPEVDMHREVVHQSKVCELESKVKELEKSLEASHNRELQLTERLKLQVPNSFTTESSRTDQEFISSNSSTEMQDIYFQLCEEFSKLQQLAKRQSGLLEKLAAKKQTSGFSPLQSSEEPHSPIKVVLPSNHIHAVHYRSKGNVSGKADPLPLEDTFTLINRGCSDNESLQRLIIQNVPSMCSEETEAACAVCGQTFPAELKEEYRKHFQAHFGIM